MEVKFEKRRVTLLASRRFLRISLLFKFYSQIIHPTRLLDDVNRIGESID